MKIRAFISVVAALALLVPAAATAQNGQGRGGQPVYWITGGGQVIAEASLQGPGDTIAFVAQGLYEHPDSDTGTYVARGQLQVISRGDDGQNRGRDQVILHGQVTCVRPGAGNEARFGGVARDPRNRTGEPFEFVVDVVDNGEGGNDTVLFREYTEPEDEDDQDVPPCDDQESHTQLRDVRLARGNLQIHDRR